MMNVLDGSLRVLAAAAAAAKGRLHATLTVSDRMND